MERGRLDNVLVARGLARTRSQAQQLIRGGHVQVDGQVTTRTSARVAETAAILVEDALPFVSRGGLKLRAALDRFHIGVDGFVALDVGSSTGGFTDCLLRAGAARVYAVDVGHEQLAPELRDDPRVTVLEDTDIRVLGALPEQPDLAVIDVSFISLRNVLPAVARFLGPGGQVVALLKPQFETGSRRHVKHGVVRDPAVRREVVRELLRWMQGEGWQIAGLMLSPVVGGEGNVEYLVHLFPPAAPPCPVDLDALLASLDDEETP